MRRTFLILFLAATSVGCERDKIEPDKVHTVDLRLKFVFRYGSHDYEIGSEYTDATGRLYRIDALRFLLSEIHVVDDFEHELARYGDIRLMVDAAATSNDLPLGRLTAAHVHQTRFKIGLPPSVNDSDPATSSAPLDDTSMHWGMEPDEGYWFFVLEGHFDSDGNDVLDEMDGTFNYRCGTDGLLRSGWALMHTELPNGGIYTVEVPVDVERMVAHLDIANIPQAMGGHPVNVQLMDSLAACFSESH